jgi:integrase
VAVSLKSERGQFRLGEPKRKRSARTIDLPELSRHTAASLLYEAGVPLDQIADLLGQTSTRMLEEHYRHRIRPSMNAAVGPRENGFGVAPAVAPSGG